MGDLVVSPQYTLMRTVTSNNRLSEVTESAIPNFVLIKITGDIEGHESGMRKTAVMVSEGKRENTPRSEFLSHQIWRYASYCFERHARLRRVVALEWEGRVWRLIVLRREHRMRLSTHTDPGYEDAEEPALPEVFSHPVASGVIMNFDSLDYVVREIHRYLAD